MPHPTVQIIVKYDEMKPNKLNLNLIVVVLTCLFHFNYRAEYVSTSAVDQLTNSSEQMQLQTFTRWCNKHLETVGDHIDNLFLDLRDGLKLIALVQVLSKKNISGNRRKSINKIHWHNNVSMVLQFLEETENLKLVNIGKSNVFLDRILTSTMMYFLGGGSTFVN